MVRRGFYGTLLIALGALSPAYLPRSSPWWQLLDSMHATGTPAKIVGTLITIGGAMLLVDAWFRLRPSIKADGERVYLDLRHWAVLLIWSLPFLFAPPVFSHDAYSYAAQGWLVHNNINPYQVGPGVLPGAFADQVSWVWRYTKTPYGPLSLQIQHLLVDVCQHRAYLSALSMRIPALVGVLLITNFLPRIAVQMRINPATTAWFATLNPLFVIDFVGGAHNDSLMLGLMVLGLWLAGWAGPSGWSWMRDRWWLVGAVMVGVATAVKQPAILAAFVLPLIQRPWTSYERSEVLIALRRVLLSFALAAGTFVLVSLATGLGFGWINAAGVPGLVFTPSPFTVLGKAVELLLDLLGFATAAGYAVTVARTLGWALFAAITVWLALTVAGRQPMRFLAWSYLAFAFCSPALHSWYVLWGGTLLPLTRASSRVLTWSCYVTVVLLSFDAVNMAWRNDLTSVGVAAVLGFVWLARLHAPAELEMYAEDVEP